MKDRQAFAIEAVKNHLGESFWNQYKHSAPKLFIGEGNPQYVAAVEMAMPKRTRQPWFDQQRMSGVMNGLVKGIRLPPLYVVEMGGRIFLYDGFHRYMAALAFGIEKIPVKFCDLPIDETKYD